LTLGSSVSWGGISLLAGSLTGRADLTIPSPGPLTLGSSGIDMSADPGKNLIINAPLTLGAAQTWNFYRTITVGGNISGSSALTLSTPDASLHTVVLTGNNSSYSGAITNGSNTGLQLGSGGTTGDPGTGQITLSTGNGRNALNVNRSDSPTFGNTLVFSSGNQGINVATAGQTATFNGAMSGSGQLFVSGAGTLILSPSSGSPGGGTSINGGTVQVGAMTTLGSQLYFTAGGGTLIYTGGSVTSSLLSANNGLQNSGANNATINIQNAGTTLTLSGVIAESGTVTTGSFVKDGPGTLVLSAANTYYEPTTIKAGTLKLSGTGLITNTITVGSGATFDVSALTTALTLGSGQALQASATGANTTGTIIGGSSKGLTLSAGGLAFTAYGGSSTAPLTASGAAGAVAMNSAPVAVTTTTSLSSGSYTLIDTASSGTVTGTAGTLTLNGVSSPSYASVAVSSSKLVLTISATMPSLSVSGTLGTVNTTYGYASASPTSFSFTGSNLSPASGNITVTAPTGYEISTSSGSGYATSLSIAYSGGALSSTTVYVHLKNNTAAGTYAGNITVSGGGAGNYAVATASSTVSPKALTMSGLSVSSKVYDGTTTTIVSGTPALAGNEAAGTGTSGDGKPITGDTVSITGTPTGTYNSKDVASATTVTYSGLSLTGTAAGNYTLTIQSAASATITKAPLSITAPTVTKVYDGGTTAGTVTVGTLSGFVGSETVTATGTATAYSSQNVGSAYSSTVSYTLANGTGGGLAGNYSLANSAIANAAITAAPLSITANNASKTYGTALTGGSGSTAFTSSGLQNSETIGTVTIAYGTGSAANAAVNTYTGSVTASAAVGGTFNAGNYSITYNPGNINVGAATASVTADAKSKTYGDANPTLTATVTGTVNGDTLSYTLATTATQFSSVGVSNITVSLGSNPNYAVSATNSTLTINAKSASVTADAKTKTYGDANPALTATVAGTVNGDTLSYTLATDATQFSSVGTSNITVSLGGNPNYTVLTTNSTLTINQRPITITAQPNTKIYDGGTSATNVPTLTAGTLASGDGFSSLTEVYSDPAVGTGKTVIPSATITNASGTVTANYAITPVNNATSVINPAQATTSLLLTNNIGRTNYYGQTLIFTAVVQTNSVNAANASSNVVFSLGGTPVWTNAVTGGVAYYTNDDLTVGTTNVTAHYLGDNNYLGSSLTVNQTVLPTTPTLTLTASAITYGQTLASSSLTSSTATNANNNANASGGFAFADNTIAPNAGVTNVWVVFTPTDTTNYTTASNTVAVTVHKADSTMAVTGPTSFTYNGAGQGPASASSTGSSGAVSYSYSGTGYGPSANAPTNAGNYTVTASLAADDNYNSATSSPTAFIINPAPALVTADAKTKTYGTVNPGLTATVMGQVIGGDTINYNLSTDAGQYSAVGVSNIFVNLGSNPNYSVLATNGTLTISQANTFVGASSTENPSGYKDAISFTATLPADATGSVVFSSTNGPISTNNASSGSATSLSITTLPRGTNLITVAYLGDGNYVGSTNSTLLQVVTNHPPVANVMTVTRTAGLALIIKLSDIATNWNDVDGDLVELTSVTMQSTNGINLFPLNWSTNLDGSIVTTNGYAYIGYTNSPNVADQISYNISDGQGGTNLGYISIVIQGSVTGTNSITGHDFSSPYSNTVTAYGIPYFYYTLERSTNLTSPVWVDVSTNQAAANGVINAVDTFWDLGGVKPSPSAFYQLKWQP
jgi:hypothetical protein